MPYSHVNDFTVFKSSGLPKMHLNSPDSFLNNFQMVKVFTAQIFFTVNFNRDNVVMTVGIRTEIYSSEVWECNTSGFSEVVTSSLLHILDSENWTLGLDEKEQILNT